MKRHYRKSILSHPLKKIIVYTTPKDIMTRWFVSFDNVSEGGVWIKAARCPNFTFVTCGLVVSSTSRKLPSTMLDNFLFNIEGRNRVVFGEDGDGFPIIRGDGDILLVFFATWCILCHY